MDYSLPGSSVHGILHEKILEWVAIPFSRGSSQPRDQTQVSRITGRIVTIWATLPQCSGWRLSLLFFLPFTRHELCLAHDRYQNPSWNKMQCPCRPQPCGLGVPTQSTYNWWHLFRASRHRLGSGRSPLAGGATLVWTLKWLSRLSFRLIINLSRLRDVDVQKKMMVQIRMLVNTEWFCHKCVSHK